MKWTTMELVETTPQRPRIDSI